LVRWLGLIWLLVRLFPFSMSIWSALPIELQHLILALVAYDDAPTARSLRLVSRDTNVLVLPIIYRNVLIETISDLRVTRIMAPPSSALHRLKNENYDPPRILSTYNTASLALVLPESLPSIENALARVGAVFSRIRYLAITSRNLSANAFWLRENCVKPKHIMLLHHGSPRPVNWRDKIFSQTTHIFTSSLDSHGRSTFADLSDLTHLAVSTHSELAENKIQDIARKLEWLLHPDTLPNLKILVLGITRFPYPPVRRIYTHLFIDPSAHEQYIRLLARWWTHLQVCLGHSKFHVLPDPIHPREEWDTWINSTSPDIWQRAISYRGQYSNSVVFEPRAVEVDDAHHVNVIDLLQTDDDTPLILDSPNARSQSSPKVDWEIDLIQREGYRESESLDPEEAGEYVTMGF